MSVKKHSSGEEGTWDNELDKYKFRGWRAVSAAVLQGKASHKIFFFFAGTGNGCYVGVVSCRVVFGLATRRRSRHSRGPEPGAARTNIRANKYVSLSLYIYIYI